MNQLGQNANTLVAKDLFTYSTEVQSLAPGSSLNSSIQIEADSNFIIQKLTQFTQRSSVEIATSETYEIPLVTVLITDTGSGRQLMDRAVPIGSMFGNGPLPFILPDPKVLMSRSIIAFTFTNFSNSTTYDTITLSLIGQKLFGTGII